MTENKSRIKSAGGRCGRCGSNTIKLTVARLNLNGGIEELALAADTVRLGAGMSATGRLAEKIVSMPRSPPCSTTPMLRAIMARFAWLESRPKQLARLPTVWIFCREFAMKLAGKFASSMAIPKPI